jgi:hypothetical protein
MRTKDGIKLKRVESNTGKYYTDKDGTVPVEWVVGFDEFTGREITWEETKVWKVKK